MNLLTLTEQSKTEFTKGTNTRPFNYNGIYITPKRLVKGNSKLYNILIFDLPAVVTCLNCGDCKDKCYALGPYRRWPNVKEAWDKNFGLAKTGDFQELVAGQISRSRNAKTVRVHVAGDFFDQDYIRRWTEVAASFPAINFYSYTKVYGKFTSALDTFNSLPNCNLINSIATDGGVNFGDQERVKKLVDLGYFVCPVTAGEDITCGLECSECVTNGKVCFYEHK